MPDLLVCLPDLPPLAPALEPLRAEGIFIRRPHPWEQTPLRQFILSHFQAGWADETSVAFHHQPITAYVAMKDQQILGFAAYECSRRNYFGPTGVDPSMRGKGVGKALLLASLAGLRDLGYTYCVIGGAGPVEFYQKAVGAIVIPFRDGRGIYDLQEEPGLR